MATKTKRYREAAGLVEADKEYEPREAIALLKRFATAKFDETVELHLRSGDLDSHPIGKGNGGRRLSQRDKNICLSISRRYGAICSHTDNYVVRKNTGKRCFINHHS